MFQTTNRLLAVFFYGNHHSCHPHHFTVPIFFGHFKQGNQWSWSTPIPRNTWKPVLSVAVWWTAWIACSPDFSKTNKPTMNHHSSFIIFQGSLKSQYVAISEINRPAQTVVPDMASGQQRWPPFSGSSPDTKKHKVLRLLYHIILYVDLSLSMI